MFEVMNSPFTEEQAQLLNQLLPQLTDPQKQWLTGYLSASVASAVKAVDNLPQTVQAEAQEIPAVQKEITILYGTQTGNCQQLAEEFTEKFTGENYDVQLQSMADFKHRDIRKIKNLLIIISTHGEGDPPDIALPFYEFLHGRRAPELPDLNYSVLALGDSSYEYFCKTGEDFDLILEKLGANRIVDRIDCDLDFDEPAEEWYEKNLSALNELTSSPAAVEVAATSTNLAPVKSIYSRTNPYHAEVLENINLSGRGSNKENRHLELLIEGSNIQFQPGDSVGIYPKNDPLLVEQLIETFSWDENELVPTEKDKEQPLKEALSEYYEITQLTKPLLEKLGALSGSEEIKLLTEGEREELQKYMYGRDLLDVITEFEIENIPAKEMIKILRKMPARLYSIANSYEANPEEIHLLIGAVRYESYGRKRNGVCSVQIAERIQEGDTLPIYIQKNDNFRLPENAETPIIMIGPGTGIAPFRSFLEEREELDIKSDAWLFFGDQHYVTDFLYQVEWQRWLNDGYLTKMDVAFSRDQEEKKYVQHKMKENQKELYEWLERGAVIYVCGDEEHMAKDVHETLIEIIEEEGSHSKDEAEQYLKDMQLDKRYQRDVY